MMKEYALKALLKRRVKANPRDRRKIQLLRKWGKIGTGRDVVMECPYCKAAFHVQSHTRTLRGKSLSRSKKKIKCLVV